MDRIRALSIGRWMITCALSALGCSAEVAPTPVEGWRADGKTDGHDAEAFSRCIAGLTQTPEKPEAYFLNGIRDSATRTILYTRVEDTSGKAIDYFGTDHLPPRIVAEAGKPFEVYYLGELVEWPVPAGTAYYMGYSHGDGAETRVALEVRTEVHPTALRTTVTMPESARGALELWFERHDPDGSVHYDSRDGENYRGVILSEVSTGICFSGAFEEVAEAPIKAGTSLDLHYEHERLGRILDATYAGYSTAKIHANARFRAAGGQPLETTRTTVTSLRTFAGGMEQGVMIGRIAVPFEARSVEIWFDGTDRAHAGPVYDSDFGANYVFRVEP